MPKIKDKSKAASAHSPAEQPPEQPASQAAAMATLQASVQISNNERCTELATMFNEAAAKGQDAELEMGMAAFAAKTEFEKNHPKVYNAFCKAIEYDPKSSGFRKLIVIGKNAKRLEPIRDRLSPHFNTIYDVARLEQPDFNKLVADHRFGRNMTAATMKEILAKDSEPPPPIPILKVYAIGDWTKDKTRRLCAVLSNSEFKDAIRLVTPPTNEERASKAMQAWSAKVHRKLCSLVRKQIKDTKRLRGSVYARKLNKQYKTELQMSVSPDLEELKGILHIIEQDDPDLLHRLQDEACKAVEMPDVSRYQAADAITPEQALADFMQERAEAKRKAKAKKLAAADQHIT